MKIKKIGTFDEYGDFIEWDVDDKHILYVDVFGSVLVNGVEIEEWTELRKRCMAGKSVHVTSIDENERYYDKEKLNG